MFINNIAVKMSQYSQFFYLYTIKISIARSSSMKPKQGHAVWQCFSLSHGDMEHLHLLQLSNCVPYPIYFPLLELYLALLCALGLWDDQQEGGGKETSEDGVVERNEQIGPALSDDLVLPVGVTTDRGFKAHCKPGMAWSMERVWEASITVCFTCVYFAAFLNRPWSVFWNRSANVTVWVDHAL